MSKLPHVLWKSMSKITHKVWWEHDNVDERQKLFDKLSVEDTPEELAEKERLRIEIEISMSLEPLHVNVLSEEDTDIQVELAQETIRNADIIINETTVLLNKHRKP